MRCLSFLSSSSPTPHVTLQQQSVEHAAAAAAEVLLAALARGGPAGLRDGEERTRLGACGATGKEQLAQPCRGGSHEGSDAREQARDGGGVRGDRPPEAGREGVVRPGATGAHGVHILG
jgi:hypothetical protein